MATAVSSLNVIFGATVAPFANALKSGERAADSFIDKVTSVGSKLLDMTGVAAVVGAAIGGVFELGKGFALAGVFETANVQLTALTGSAGNAQVMLSQLKEFAASSPFAFPELLDASKRLIAVGVSASNVTPLLKQIGDVAAGTGQPISAISDIFARVAAEGKVSSRELKQFGRDGIPVMQVLAAQFNTTAAGVSELAENGQIGFAQLQAAFASMTGPGGRFAGIVTAQSHTIDGALHTLRARVEDTLAGVAEKIITTFDFTGALTTITAFTGEMGEKLLAGIDVVAPYFSRLTIAAESGLAGIYTTIAPVFNTLWADVTAAWGGIESFISSHSTMIQSAVEGIATVIGAAAIPAVLGGIVAAVGAVGSAFASAGAMLAIPLAPAIALGVGLAVLNERFNLIAVASNIVSEVTTYIGQNWQTAADMTVAFGMAVVNVVQGAFNGLVDITTTIWGGITTAFSAGWTYVMGSTATGAASTTTAFQSIVSGVETFIGGITTSLNVVGYLFSHIGDVIRLAGDTIALNIVTTGNQIGYVFTKVIPATLKWAGTLFVDFVSAAGTVFKNLGSNIVSVFENIPALVRGKTDWSHVWTPMLDGFESSAKALPEIAARQKGALEQSLGDQVDGDSKTLFDGMANSLIASGNKAQTAATAVKSTISDTIKSFTAPVVPTIEKPEIPKPDPLKLTATIEPNTMTLNVQPEIHEMKAMRTGSAEAQLARYMQPIMPSPAFAQAGPASGAMAPTMATATAGAAAAHYGVPTIAQPTVTAITPQMNPVTPTTPTIAAANIAPAAVAQASDEKAVKELQTANQWFTRIEYNTRGSNQPTVVSIG